MKSATNEPQIASGTLNTMIERAGYRPLRDAPKLAPLITAVGFSFILQNVGLLWKGGSQVGIPDLINAQHTIVTIFGVTIENADVLSIGVTIPLLIVMTTTSPSSTTYIGTSGNWWPLMVHQKPGLPSRKPIRRPIE